MAEVNVCLYDVNLCLCDCSVCIEMVTMASRPVLLSRSLGSTPGLAIPELCLHKQDWEEKEGLYLNRHCKSSLCLHVLPICHKGNYNVCQRGPQSPETLILSLGLRQMKGICGHPSKIVLSSILPFPKFSHGSMVGPCLEQTTHLTTTTN